MYLLTSIFFLGLNTEGKQNFFIHSVEVAIKAIHFIIKRSLVRVNMWI